MLRLFVANAYAQGITNPALTNGSVAAGQGASSVGKIISAVIGVFFLFGVIMGFLHLVFGSFQWITAGGDKTKLENARNRIVEALIGLVVLSSIWAIMKVVAFVLNLGPFPELNLPQF